MEDHRDAYLFWKESGVSGGFCVHVDAHLDVNNFDAPGLNCANFLTYAIEEGLVAQLVWVIPPHLCASSPNLLDWARTELQNWVWLTVNDYRSLESHFDPGHEVVTGSLLGAALSICRSADFGRVERRASGPLLLDIDVDYFLAPDDEVFQSTGELRAQLALPEPDYLTVAVSVKGGYTPLARRYLADLVWLDFFEGAGGVDELARAIQDGLAEHPSWARAASLALRTHGEAEHADWEAAAAVDSAYRPDPFDVASCYLWRRNYLAFERWIGEIDKDEGARYLQALAEFRQERYVTALEHLKSLLVVDPAQPHVRLFCARILVLLGRRAEAIEQLQKAEPQSPAVERELAELYKNSGLPEQARAAYSRAIKMAPDLLVTLGSRYELASLLRKSKSLADLQQAMAEVNLVLAADLAGSLRVKAESLHGRLRMQLALRGYG